MSELKVFQEFLNSAKKLTSAGERRSILREICSRAGIQVDNDLNLKNSNVTGAQIEQVYKTLDSMAVLKIAAKRIFRENGLTL